MPVNMSEQAINLNDLVEHTNDSGMMTDPNTGETLMVSEYYCAHCNAIHGNAYDGEAICVHKVALSIARRPK